MQEVKVVQKCKTINARQRRQLSRQAQTLLEKMKKRTTQPVSVTIQCTEQSDTGKQHQYTISVRAHKANSVWIEREVTEWGFEKASNNVFKRCNDALS